MLGMDGRAFRALATTPDGRHPGRTARQPFGVCHDSTLARSYFWLIKVKKTCAYSAIYMVGLDNDKGQFEKRVCEAVGFKYEFNGKPLASTCAQIQTLLVVQTLSPRLLLYCFFFEAIELLTSRRCTCKLVRVYQEILVDRY